VQGSSEKSQGRYQGREVGVFGIALTQRLLIRLKLARKRNKTIPHDNLKGMPEREQPIEPAIRERANEIAKLIDGALNQGGAPHRYGFALLMFKLGESANGDRMNYISNAAREDMLLAMKEFIARAEGRYPEPTKRG
jgi:hypothetical protein